jgi:hypothetical protein
MMNFRLATPKVHAKHARGQALVVLVLLVLLGAADPLHGDQPDGDGLLTTHSSP